MIPNEFKEKMKTLLKEDEYTEFLTAFEEEERAYRSLRINRTKSGDDAKTVFEGLGAQNLEQVPWETGGFYYDASAPYGKHPYHEAGLYYIQESSAMAPVSFLDPKPGDRVLDLCAAPGGKSTQIADRLQGEGILVTNEINKDRSKILSLNIERMGIKNALVLNEDSGHLADIFEGYFDKILVDAPCSGEGMFRKNDNAGDEWSASNVKLCANRQDEILCNAAKMLMPGGRLVYSTCTFSPEENEGTVYRFLTSHKDFHTKEVALIGGMEKGRSSFLDYLGLEADGDLSKEIENSVRLWPHRVKGEGHFLCVFEREGNAIKEGTGKYVPGGRNISLKKESLIPLMDFLKNTLKSEDEITVSKDGILSIGTGTKNLAFGVVIGFGEQLYLCPEDMPSVKALKVARCGLHLGTVKKDRFEPSHALALFLKKEYVNATVELPSDGADIKSFLNGQTLRISSDNGDAGNKKGWCLVTTDGYSIGWGKLSGTVLKNHYPKGLRINY